MGINIKRKNIADARDKDRVNSVRGARMRDKKMEQKMTVKRRLKCKVLSGQKYSNLRVWIGLLLLSATASFSPSSHSISLPLFLSISLCYSGK